LVPGFAGVNAAEGWRLPPNSSIPEVKERLELYVYSFCGALWPFLGLTLPFYIIEKGKAIPIQVWIGPRGFSKIEATRISRYSSHEDGNISFTYRWP
jgi:hypothetical protein